LKKFQYFQFLFYVYNLGKGKIEDIRFFFVIVIRFLLNNYKLLIFIYKIYIDIFSYENIMMTT